MVGVGLSSADTGSNWIATRPQASFSESFVRRATYGNASWRSFTGRGFLASQPSVYLFARAGSIMKYADNIDTLNWKNLPCGLALGDGLPTGSGLGRNVYARSTNGRLLLFPDAGACQDLGENLTSSPSIRDITQLVLFRGGSGNLWAREHQGSQHYNLDLPVP